MQSHYTVMLKNVNVTYIYSAKSSLCIFVMITIFLNCDEYFAILFLKDAIAKGSYLKDPLVVKKGDVEEAFKASDHIIEGDVRVGGQEHFYLETQCALAIPKGEANEMEIFASSQSLSHTQVSQISLRVK